MSDLVDSIKEDTPFKLYANCVLTKGVNRSIIIDLQRNSYFLIPNSLYGILIKYSGKKIKAILKDKSILYTKNEIIKYFDFLYKNELIFFTQMPSLFPQISFKNWQNPTEIYQVIIDIDKKINLLNENLFDSLNKLNCKYLQLRLFGNISESELLTLLNFTEKSSFIGIDIFINFQSDINVDSFLKKLISFPRVNNMVFYNAPIQEAFQNIGSSEVSNVILAKQNIVGCLNCGEISKNYFSINIDSYTKSISHNSCLYGKISIDIEGNIKNCPSMQSSFGNISNVSIEKAIQNKKFKNYWNIRKEEIEICKDCEFRNICTDCRAYIQDPTNKYSKPLKCGYNPYSNLWEDWSRNVLSSKSISYYKMETIINLPL